MKLREGIIVRSQKYQENSKIISLINDEELTTFLVRGGANLKSRNFAYANELVKIGYDYTAKSADSLKIMTTGTILNNYTNIKTDFNKLNDALLILESTYQLGDHITDFTTYYYFTDDILNLLNDNPYTPYYLIIYRLKILYLLGVGPVFSKCINCDSKENLKGFVFLNGGMHCADCASVTDSFYQEDVIALLKFLYLTKLPNLSIEALNKLPNYLSELSKFLDMYYETFLGYRSRAEKVIKKMKTY